MTKPTPELYNPMANKPMDNHKPIPERWEQLRLSISSQAGRHAIIAGGAIRDHLLGIPIKDIDVFVLGMPAEAAKTIFNAEIVEYSGVKEASHRFCTIDGLPVDLVFSRFDHVDEVLASFDLAICQAAWNGLKYVLTDEFKRDFEDRSITVLRPSEGGHLERIVAKPEPHGFKVGATRDRLGEVRERARQKGYRLMHRRNDQYWLMRENPMDLEEILEQLAW